MGRKWKKKAPVLPRVLAAIVLLFAVLIYLRRPATDSTLSRHFHRNRAEFLELRSMLATNPPVFPLTPGAETPLWSQEDYQRYKELLRRAGVIRVLEEGTDVRFQLVGALETGKGERIAVTWTELQPDFIVGSINEFRKKSGARDHAYRPLTNEWYLWVAK